MAWNEPGGNNRDPWGGNGRDQGPPDLDEIFRKLSNKFGGLFGGKGSGSNDGSGGGSGGSLRPLASFGILKFNSPLLWVLLAIMALVWLASGFYIVEQGKQGVELRFGKFTNITDPGLKLSLSLAILKTVEIVDVAQRRAEEIGYRTGVNSRQAA